jgi:RHS repeat-associated protein
VTERSAEGDAAGFSYDASGQLVHARNRDAEVRLERDALGRVITETCNGRSVRSEYDLAGRRTRRVTPSGARARWDYDNAGRPAELHTAGQAIRFGYDEAGQETRRELPGGLVLTQDWDPVGRLTAQSLAAASVSGPGLPAPGGPAGRLLQRRAYSYRPDGCLTGIDDLLAGPQRFGLDPAGRVTRVTGSGWAERYAYDPAGNVTSAAWPVPPDPTAGLPATGVPAADVPAADVLGGDVQGPREYTGTLVTRAGSVRYEHDECGRITLRQRKRDSRRPDTWRYQWGADDRLTSVTTPDGTIWRYLYDPFGRRIAKQRLGEDGNVAAETTFTWDGPVLAEQAASYPGPAGPAPEHVITWDYQPNSFTPATQSERTIPPGAPQGQVDEQFYAIVTDLIGNPTELTAPDGSLAGYQQHTLWGGTRWTPGGAQSPLRFPGQYADPETGLHYNHHRYYDPVTGRYLTPDPLGLAPAPNPHTYVPNPQTQTDPLGLASPCPNAAGRTFGTHSSQDLLNAAQSGDRNGLTQAGRALQKHADRAGSFFQGRSSGPAAVRNAQGLQAVSEILNNPASRTEVLNRVINIWAPTGQGVRYNIDGSFMGFLEPVP